MAVPDWVRIWFLASSAASTAKSVSLMVDMLAAVFWILFIIAIQQDIGDLGRTGKMKNRSPIATRSIYQRVIFVRYNVSKPRAAAACIVSLAPFLIRCLLTTTGIFSNQKPLAQN